LKLWKELSKRRRFAKVSFNGGGFGSFEVLIHIIFDIEKSEKEESFD
jgi:hypothetical protein